ncbi:MAG: hemerythrin family protein [Lachnospiraceae bacterium]|nr:hemerythrin family protein [Lachnospiraceae bacterium]
MFDFNFNWKPEMEVGVSIIDEQHKELFRIARNIEQLVITKCIGVQSKLLLDIVCDLREYVSYNNYVEATFMTEWNYSGKEEHIRQHDEFCKKIIGIDCKRLGQSPYKVLCEIKETIQDWVFAHILMEDKKMCQELKQKGYTN